MSHPSKKASSRNLIQDNPKCELVLSELRPTATRERVPLFYEIAPQIHCEQNPNLLFIKGRFINRKSRYWYVLVSHLIFKRGLMYVFQFVWNGVCEKGSANGTISFHMITRNLDIWGSVIINSNVSKFFIIGIVVVFSIILFISYC